MIGDAALEKIKQLSGTRRNCESPPRRSPVRDWLTWQALAHLEELDLSENSQVFDDGLAHLAGLTSLKDLNLWRVGITDEGVKHLAGLTSLERLNLDNTQLTDAGLQHLAGPAAADVPAPRFDGRVRCGARASGRTDVAQRPEGHAHAPSPPRAWRNCRRSCPTRPFSWSTCRGSRPVPRGPVAEQGPQSLVACGAAQVLRAFRRSPHNR